MRKRGAFTVGQINESTEKKKGGRRRKSIWMNSELLFRLFIEWKLRNLKLFLSNIFSLRSLRRRSPSLPQTQNKSRQDSSISCVGWLWIRKGDSLLCLLRYALIVDKEVSSTIEARTREGGKATVSTITMCGGVLSNCDVIWNDNWMVKLSR